MDDFNVIIEKITELTNLVKSIAKKKNFNVVLKYKSKSAKAL
jgi:hypothetical protein